MLTAAQRKRNSGSGSEREITSTLLFCVKRKRGKEEERKTEREEKGKTEREEEEERKTEREEKRKRGRQNERKRGRQKERKRKRRRQNERKRQRQEDQFILFLYSCSVREEKLRAPLCFICFSSSAYYVYLFFSPPVFHFQSKTGGIKVEKGMTEGGDIPQGCDPAHQS